MSSQENTNNKKPVVVWALNDFLVGGAQRVAIDVLRELGDHEHEWHLVTFFEFPDKTTLYRMLPEYVHVHRVSFSSIKDIRAWRTTMSVLDTIQPDAVISNTFFANFVLRVLQPLYRYSISIVEQNTHVSKSLLHRVIDKVLSYQTHAIGAVSKKVLDFTARQEWIPRSKFRLIYNGANIDRAAHIASTREHLLVCVARIVEQKNHTLLLDAFAQLRSRDEYSDYTLVLLGEGKLMTEMMEYCTQLGIQAYVDFAGYKDPYPYYARASAYVSTSKIEGMSLAYIEAMACGLPIVATQTAGTDELVEDGVSGVIVPQGSSPDSVADAMAHAITSFETMSPRARIQAQSFGIGPCAKAYRALIAEMVKR